MFKTATLVHSLAPSVAAETKVLDSAKGVVQALVSVSGNRDSDGDVVVPGASLRSLGRVTPKGVWHHDWTTPVAKTVEALEVYPGDPSLPGDLLTAGYGALRVTAQFNLDSEKGREAFATVRFFGPEQEWSVGYEVDDFYLGGGNPTGEAAMLEQASRHRWLTQAKAMLDDDVPTRFITAWTVFEFSPVLFGANRLTRTEETKGLERIVDTVERIVVRLEALEAKATSSTSTEDENLKQAVTSHGTATSTASWDGAANEARCRSGEDAAYYRKVYAWQDPEGDPATKAAWRFIHHEVDADGNPGPANLTACSTGIGVLNGGRGGTTIPDADRQGVYDHLARHLRDAEREPPPLKALDELEGKADELEGEEDAEEKSDPPAPHAFDGDPDHPHRCSVCGAGAQRSWHVAKELDDDELEESSDDELEESAAEKAAAAAIDAFARTLEEQVAWLAGGDKAGRVQARRNVDRLRRAMEALGEMLDEIAAEEDDGGKGDLEDPYAAAARLLAETYRTAFGT